VEEADRAMGAELMSEDMLSKAPGYKHTWHTNQMGTTSRQQVATSQRSSRKQSRSRLEESEPCHSSSLLQSPIWQPLIPNEQNDVPIYQ